MESALKDLTKLLDVTETTTEEMFKDMDENNDNTIDAKEFIDAIMEKGNAFGQNMAVKLVQMFNTVN